MLLTSRNRHSWLQQGLLSRLSPHQVPRNQILRTILRKVCKKSNSKTSQSQMKSPIIVQPGLTRMVRTCKLPSKQVEQHLLLSSPTRMPKLTFKFSRLMTSPVLRTKCLSITQTLNKLPTLFLEKEPSPGKLLFLLILNLG